jgi:TonB family protein
MKRFFFISALFHGTLLLILFSWEIPQADRMPLRNRIEVFLVEKMEEKIEEKKLQGAIPVVLKKAFKQDLTEKKEIEGARQITPTNLEERKEQPKQERLETNQIKASEERTKIEEKAPAEEGNLKANGEDERIIQAKLTPQIIEEGITKELATPAGRPQISVAKGNAGSAFISFPGPEMRREGIQGGRGEKDDPFGKGGGDATQLSKIRTSPKEGDSILLEIMRRIEGAKRYPKAARKMHIEGRATVRFKIKPDGKVDSVEVVESSGSDILDQASLETVQRAVPLPFKEGWLKVGIVFKIL